MTLEQKRKLLVDYIVEVVRNYECSTEEFIRRLPLIHRRVFSKLTDDEYDEYDDWFGKNVSREQYDEYLNYIDDMGLDVELGIVSNEVIYKRVKEKFWK